MRTPMKRFGKIDELVGAAVFLVVGRGVVRDRPHARRRRRVPGERGESVKAALVISERDNVATALQPLEPGRDARRSAGTRLRFASAVPSGHKIALRAIHAGEAGHQVRQPDRAGDGRDRRPARTCTRTTSPARRGRGDLEAPQRRAAAAAGRAARRAQRRRRTNGTDDAMTTAQVSTGIVDPTAASARATTCSSCRR